MASSSPTSSSPRAGPRRRLRLPAAASVGALVRFFVLLAVTAAAVLVMAMVSGGWWGEVEKPPATVVDESGKVFLHPSVTVEELTPAWHEITDTYTGMIRPLERYSLAFEVAGRVVSLGKNAAGQSLDEGDRVQHGQVLARLDPDAYHSRVQEAATNLEKARGDLERADRVRLSQRTAITESEYQERLTDYKLAVTRLDLAKENLSETTLAFSLDELDKTDPGAPDDTGTDAATESRSGAATEPAPRPATGDRRRFVIARREISPGESVSAHQVVMEVLQVDHVLLVVGVPESRVRPLIARMREVRATRPGDDAPSRPEPGELKEPDAERFEVHVELLSSGQLGDGGQILDGDVYRIAEAADTTSGLFEVEVLLDNADGMLRPGLIARATIVVDRVRGYDLPISAAVFSNDEASLFTVTSEEVDVKLMHWTLGRRRVDRAQRIDLGKRWARPGGRLVAQWIEQDGRIVIPLPEKPLGRIVTRGQHRVTDGIRVQIVEQDGEIGRVPPEQPALKVGDGLARPRSR